MIVNVDRYSIGPIARHIDIESHFAGDLIVYEILQHDFVMSLENYPDILTNI